MAQEVKSIKIYHKEDVDHLLNFIKIIADEQNIDKNVSKEANEILLNFNKKYSDFSFDLSLKNFL